MSGAHSQWLLTTVNAVRELVVSRLRSTTLDPASRRDVEMALEELDVIWEELQGQAEMLTRENQRYAEFFDNAPDAYVITDCGGNIREANRAAVELLRVERDGLMHKPLGRFVPEEGRAAFLTHFVGVVLNQAASKAWECRLHPPGSAPLRALFSVRAIPLGKSGVGGLCWLIRPLG